MTRIPVSVVVVSRDRPDALRLCLTGIMRLNYEPFEVIVVADAVGIAVAKEVSEQIKTVAFDEANISTARNAGVNAAGGEVIAFIDDDAVPEPQWLRHLVAPFARRDVDAAGGFVLGRNGISFQWKARMAFADGTAVPFEVSETSIHQGSAGRAIKTEGTNMALRRTAICEMGGFDPRFVFYFDETDVNMRLAERGGKTAIVPLAQVHHGYAASVRRTANRVPLTLFEIGASSAVFASKHNAASMTQMRRDSRLAQRKRLLRAMVQGEIVPSDVRKIMATFDKGWSAGLEREAETVKLGKAHDLEPIAPMAQKEEHTVISGRYFRRKDVLAEAARAARGGGQVSAYVLTFTSIFHHVQFDVNGFWLQRGGQFGRSTRESRLFRFWTFSKRVAHEVKRVKSVREI